MGTLGKILLGINLLAAAGVAYFATQDYAKRQEVTATAVKYQLVLVGVPVEAPAQPVPDESSAPFPIEMPDGSQLETVHPKLLMNYFAGAEGGAQFPASIKLIDLGTLEADKQADAKEKNLATIKGNASQIGEVERVEKQLKAQLDAMAPAELLFTLCGKAILDTRTTPARPILDPKYPAYLVRLAETYDEREFVRSLGYNVQLDPSKATVNLAVARAMLDKKFAALKAKPDSRAAEAEAATLKEATEGVRTAGVSANRAHLTYVAARDGKDPNETKLEDDAIKLRVKLIEAEAKLKKVLTEFGTAATRDDGDRKKRIAHLLLHLDSSAAWQKRVGLVVGLRTYSTVLGEQVNRLRDMASRAQDQKVHDQAKFSEEYELIKTLAVQQSLLLDRQIAITAEYRDQWAKDRDAIKKRHGQLLQREEALVSIRAQVTDSLAKQSVAEADLFTVQKGVGETLRLNFELEAKLDAAEQKAGK